MRPVQVGTGQPLPIGAPASSMPGRLHLLGESVDDATAKGLPPHLHTTRDLYGTCAECLQCGYMTDLPQKDCGFSGHPQTDMGNVGFMTRWHGYAGW